MSTVLDYYYYNIDVNLSSPFPLPIESCYAFNLVFYGIVVGVVCTLGVLGNALSVAVLQKDNHNRVAIFLLQSLAVADTLVLLISFTILSVIYALLGEQREMVAAILPYVVKYAHPAGYMAQCATIWITVLLALNRYIAIIKPFHAVKWCTISKARLQVATVAVLAVILNFPRFFQYEVIVSGNIVGLRETAIGEHTVFGVVYSNIIYTVVILLIPLVTLGFINSRLIMEVKCGTGRGLSRQPSFTRPPLPQEDNITFIMVIIIVLLIVCHTPDRIVQIYRYFFTTHSQLQCGETLYYLSSVCNLLIIISSSSNFVIYYVVRRRFRRTLIAKVHAWCKLKKHHEQPTYLDPHPTPNSFLLTRRNTDGGLVPNGDVMSPREGDVLFTLDGGVMSAAEKRGSAPSILEHA